MRDPVTGFDYPALWVEKCQQPELLGLVETGLAVLTASGTILRRGFTTGTTAAAACKAAILSLDDDDVSAVTLNIPCGLAVTVPVKGSEGNASCNKYAGDYPSDVTAGIEFLAHVTPAAEGIQMIPGAGIGRFSRDTPRYRKGTPAISTAPLSCILTAIDEALATTGLPGVTVTLSVPLGEKVAKKTLNPRVGVEGGISVLGTTGLVEPWDDHLEESIRARVAVGKPVVITTGRVGLRYSRMLFPDREVVLVGGKIGEALDAASGEVILCGLPALILKFIAPGILDGTGYATVEELSASPVFDHIVQTTLSKFNKEYPRVRVVLVNRDGAIIGESP
jgi:cobalt-precorrin-5B (C1)-methyltransferase